MLRSRPPPARRSDKPDELQTSLVRLVENVVVVVHTAFSPSDDEWDAYLQTLVAAANAHGGDLTRCRQLMMTDGGGPNSVQRLSAQRTLAAVNGEAMPLAVVSSSPAARGIVTAFNWMKMNIRMFHPMEVGSAFEFLHVGKGTRDAIWDALEAIQDELGILETIQVARDTLRP